MWRQGVGLLAAVLGVALCGPRALAQDSPKERTQLSADVEIREGVDDNADGNGTVSSLLEVSPLLRYHQEFKRGAWELQYQPTLRDFSAFDTQDRVDHLVDFATDWRLGKRWSLNFNQRWLRSTNPFLRVADSRPDEPTVERVLFGANNGFVGLEQRFTRLASDLTFTYRMGRYDVMSFGADYFRQDESSQPLLSQEVQNFRVAYQRQLGRNKFLGTIYSHQHFIVEEADQRVRTNSVLVSFGYELRPGTRLDVFAGPQLSSVRATPTLGNSFFLFPLAVEVDDFTTSLALGALFSLRVDDRTWFNFDVSRRTSEGGGFTGTSIQESARINVSRQFNYRFRGHVAGYYTDNRSLVGLTTRDNLRAYGATVGFDYHFSRRVSLNGQYHFSRFASGADALRSLNARNRFVVGIRYSFGTLALGH